MSRATRLFLCRVGFVVLCVVPTLSVVGWILVQTADRFSWAGKAEWEQVLTQRLGVITEIGQVRYSRLGAAELTAVRLLNAESGAAIVEASRVEIAAQPYGWQVWAERPVVAADQLDVLVNVVAPRILANRHAARVVSIAPCNVVVTNADWKQSLAHMQGELRFSSEQTVFELTCRLPGEESANDSIRFVATRDRSAAAPVTKYRLDTGHVAAPCRLAAAILPQWKSLGNDCRFFGAVDVSYIHGKTVGQVSGTFTQVDLDNLVTERFGHQLSGMATIRIERGLIDDGKLTELRGTIQSTAGAISQSLIQSASEHLGLNAAEAETAGGADELVAFERLAMEFEAAGAALRLRGIADPNGEGVLLTAATRSMLIAPPDHSVAAVALLRTLLPDREFLVPATRQTSALVRLLPVPDATELRVISRSHTPTRLVPATTASTPAAVRQPVLR